MISYFTSPLLTANNFRFVVLNLLFYFMCFLRPPGFRCVGAISVPSTRFGLCPTTLLHFSAFSLRRFFTFLLCLLAGFGTL
jgi:hypothetical protein